VGELFIAVPPLTEGIKMTAAPRKTLSDLTAKKEDDKKEETQTETKKEDTTPETSPLRTDGDSAEDKEKGKSGYVVTEDVPSGTDNTATTRAPETIEADKANRAELQDVADRQKEIDEEIEKEKKKSKLHKVADIGHDRKLIITNDTDKALEEIDRAPYDTDVINNGAVVWTGDLTDRYAKDALEGNRVVASRVKQRDDK
jgi:hypothetical protein